MDIAAASGPKGSPRVDVVFRLWQCDKENHGWREGPPVTVLCQSFRSAGRAFTLRLNQFRTKRRIQLCVAGRHSLTQNIGRFKTTIRPLETHSPSQLSLFGACSRGVCVAPKAVRVLDLPISSGVASNSTTPVTTP